MEQVDVNVWEGLVFINPRSRYTCKRSKLALKYKPVYEDVATVVGYEAGKTGKLVGKIGAIWVEYTWTDKVETIHGGRVEFIGKTFRFKVSGLEATETVMAEELYPVGSELPFQFFVISANGVPQHCSIYRGM